MATADDDRDAVGRPASDEGEAPPVRVALLSGRAPFPRAFGKLLATLQKLLRRLLGGASIGAIARELGMTEAKVVAEGRAVTGRVRGRADEGPAA